MITANFITPLLFPSLTRAVVFLLMLAYSSTIERNKKACISTLIFLAIESKRLKITDEIQAIKISFYRHTTTQSFSEDPAEKQTINLSVTDNGTKFQFYEGIHPSWDKNQNSINDCENDGVAAIIQLITAKLRNNFKI